MQQGQEIGPILFKLRFLASRLGSHVLEEWVKYESDGYPGDVEVPEYRRIGVSYTATFSGPFGSGIRNAPIPTYLIDKYAGKSWSSYAARQSISSIDALVADGMKAGGVLEIDASNLILLLQGKVYSGYACNGVDGNIGTSSLIEIQNAVRSRVLDLTIELEKSVPVSADIGLDKGFSGMSKDAEKVTHITQQIVHGNITTISNSGASSHFSLNITQGDATNLADELSAAGIDPQDAAEFAEIVASESPQGVEEPFGDKAKAWIAKNIGKAADGTWKAGIGVATKALTEAALKYYGLK